MPLNPKILCLTFSSLTLSRMSFQLHQDPVVHFNIAATYWTLKRRFRYWLNIYNMFFLLLFMLLQLFLLFLPFPISSQSYPLPSPHQSPYRCLCPWIVHKCSLVSPSPSFIQYVFNVTFETSYFLFVWKYMYMLIPYILSKSFVSLSVL